MAQTLKTTQIRCQRLPFRTGHHATSRQFTNDSAHNISHLTNKRIIQTIRRRVRHNGNNNRQIFIRHHAVNSRLGLQVSHTRTTSHQVGLTRTSTINIISSLTLRINRVSNIRIHRVRLTGPNDHRMRHRQQTRSTRTSSRCATLLRPRLTLSISILRRGLTTMTRRFLVVRRNEHPELVH